MKKKQAHLIYMTGLSVDKVRMNNITENINFDKDYSYWLEKSQKDMNHLFSENNKRLGKYKQILEKLIEKHTTEPIDFLFDFFSDDSYLNNIDEKINNNINQKISKVVRKGIKPFTKLVFEKFNYKDIKEISSNYKEFFILMNNYKNQVKSYVNGDFFSLYISNQSDSIGLQPLSKLSQKNSFTVEHAYCDWSYYDNQYIDHIVLKVNKNKLHKDWEKELNRTFEIHINDILFSKTIYDNDYIQRNLPSKNNKLISFADLVLKDSELYSKQDVIHTLSDRNFFGVSLLSQIIYTLKELSNTNQIDINIEESFNSKEFHFLKELLEMSTDTKINIVNNIESTLIST